MTIQILPPSKEVMSIFSEKSFWEESDRVEIGNFIWQISRKVL